MIKSKIYSILPKMNLKGTIIEELVKDSLICAVLKNYKAGEKGLLTWIWSIWFNKIIL